MNIILFGPPGAGKGTQARRLQSALDVPHISSGDALRAIARMDTPLAREIHGYMRLGELVPDEQTQDVMLVRLNQPDVEHGFILDGFPRTVRQAEWLDDVLRKTGKEVDAALYIAVPEAVVVRRLASRAICPICGATYNLLTQPPKRDMVCDVCGGALTYRDDESPEVVRTRLHTYVHQTEPLIGFYRSQGKLQEADGSLEPDQVWEYISMALAINPLKEPLPS